MKRERSVGKNGTLISNFEEGDKYRDLRKVVHPLVAIVSFLTLDIVKGQWKVLENMVIINS